MGKISSSITLVSRLLERAGLSIHKRERLVVSEASHSRLLAKTERKATAAARANNEANRGEVVTGSSVEQVVRNDINLIIISIILSFHN